MSGLSLLLKLLELLRCDEADRLVPGDQLGASRHRGQDDVPAQTADAARTRRGRGERGGGGASVGGQQTQSEKPSGSFWWFETLSAQFKLVRHVFLPTLERH